ncbi:MAG: hypothetical protein R3B96_03430 [Pirellulaceae bacterium]
MRAAMRMTPRQPRPSTTRAWFSRHDDGRNEFGNGEIVNSILAVSDGSDGEQHEAQPRQASDWKRRPGGVTPMGAGESWGVGGGKDRRSPSQE